MRESADYQRVLALKEQMAERCEALAAEPGVRYTEERLAAIFDPVADGYHVLRLLANEQLTVAGAARIIQKLLKGHVVRTEPFVFHKELTGKNKCSNSPTSLSGIPESGPSLNGSNASGGGGW
jgi:hypothetical protein